MLILMNSDDMLLEVIKTRPFLVNFFASFSLAAKRFGHCSMRAKLVDTLLVPVEIIDRTKSFSGPLAILKIAVEVLLVLQHVLSIDIPC